MKKILFLICVSFCNPALADTPSVSSDLICKLLVSNAIALQDNLTQDGAKITKSILETDSFISAFKAAGCDQKYLDPLLEHLKRDKNE